MDATTTCEICFHHCSLLEGMTGLCRGRKCVDGEIVPANYGRITSIALDPIEKKPFCRFMPGSLVLSIGSYGCNLRCPFCQNHSISQTDDAPYREMSPAELCDLALELRSTHGNIGVAYTYNEPLISFEYLLDCMRLVHDAKMKNCVVSNGTAEPKIFRKLLPYIDAINIDVKGFTPAIYERLGGNLEQVKENVALAARHAHVEITSLIVPGFNDKASDMREQAAWLASIDPAMPLHLTRYFPHYRMKSPRPTDIALLLKLQSIAEESLETVVIGNV